MLVWPPNASVVLNKWRVNNGNCNSESVLQGSSVSYNTEQKQEMASQDVELFSEIKANQII